MTITFHLDENMPRAVAEGLRRRGYDVTAAADSDLIGASDQDHLDFARRNQRVLVTRDVDFLRLNAQQARITTVSPKS